MIKRAREVLKFIFYFKIQDHKVVKFQGKYVGRHPFQDFVPSIAPHIPDVEFVINMIDEPKILNDLVFSILYHMNISPSLLYLDCIDAFSIF